MYIKEALKNILDKKLEMMKENFNAALTSKAIQKLEEKKIEIAVGTQSSGQGHETTFAQVMADQFGVTPEEIKVVTGDTRIVVSGGGTHSDRSIRLGGFVMVKASEQIIEKGIKIAAHLMEAAASDIEFRKGDGPARFQVKGTDRAVTIFDAARAAEIGRAHV